MGQRTVPDVMKECGQPYRLAQSLPGLRGRKLEMRKYVVEGHARQMADAQRMKKAVMSGTRKAELRKTQLFDLPQALIRLRVQNIHFGVRYWDIAMYWVTHVHTLK